MHQSPRIYEYRKSEYPSPKVNGRELFDKVGSNCALLRRLVQKNEDEREEIIYDLEKEAHRVLNNFIKLYRNHREAVKTLARCPYENCVDIEEYERKSYLN